MSFARELRKGSAAPEQHQTEEIRIVLVLDDVYDTFNVGGMYRVGDAVGVSHIYHGGGTPMPPDPKIARSSVGLYQYIPYSHVDSTVALVEKLKHEGYHIVSLEQAEGAVPYNHYTYPLKTALVVGNETFGVKKEVMDASDGIVELPMYGINKSVNVVVATGIVLYQIRQSLTR
ncbi:MAG: TrmH family RNA methyltransferase [Candidatus Roizmanbacteria bacterium]|nr:TrmH family RNA methyltransferase [Candidatus Roizmanbacteria bacterium]